MQIMINFLDALCHERTREKREKIKKKLLKNLFVTKTVYIML